MAEITLEWQELQKFGDKNISVENGTYKAEDVRGVYIWGFMVDDRFIPYYVGKSDNIHFRIFEHIGALLGGAYTIYHQAVLKDFSKHKPNFKSWEPDDILNEFKNAIVYYPKNSTSFKWFIENRNNSNVKTHIDYMVDSFRYTYAEYILKDDEFASLYDLEKYLIRKLGMQNLGNIRGGNPKDGFTLINKTKNSTDKELNKLISLLNKSDNV